MPDLVSPNDPLSPLDDPSRWPALLESVGVDSILVVIHQHMGQRLRDKCSAEDIWQQTLEHAWRDRAKFRWEGIASFRAWLLAIAKHRIQDEADRLDASKRGGNAKTSSFSELQPTDSGSSSPFLPGITTTPDRLASYKERAQNMRDALATLPAELEVLVRRYLFEQEVIEDIAASLGIPRSTAYSRFHKGSKLYAAKLKELMTPLGLAKKKAEE